MTTDYPDDLVFAQICDRFHKLPSEVMNEDYGDMMRVWALLNTYENAANAIAKQKSGKK
jgi:hypothetical protein